MTAPALRPLSTGEVLDVAFSLYRRHFPVLALIAIVSQSIGLVFSIYVTAGGGVLAMPVLFVVSMVLSTVCSAIGLGASTKVVAESYLGRTTTAAEALRWVLPSTGRLVAVTMMASLLAMLGFILLIVPGLILACGMAVSASALVVEGLGSSAALTRSWELTKGHRWRVFGVLAVAFVVISIVSAATGFITALFGFAVTADSITPLIVSTAVLAVLSMLTYPYIYCAVTVLYYDLRVRKEGFDLEVLESQLAPA